jgi:hypothetical protein
MPAELEEYVNSLRVEMKATEAELRAQEEEGEGDDEEEYEEGEEDEEEEYEEDEEATKASERKSERSAVSREPARPDDFLPTRLRKRTQDIMVKMQADALKVNYCYEFTVQSVE